MHGMFCRTLLGTGLVAGFVALHGPRDMASHVQHMVTGHVVGFVPPEGCPLEGGPHCGGPMAMLHEAFAAMELTQEQREAIHETLMSRRPEMVTVIEPLMKAGQTLHNEILAESADEAAIRTAATKLGASLGDAAVLLADLKADIIENAQLTPEQVKKFSEVKPGASMHEMFEKHLKEAGTAQ